MTLPTAVTHLESADPSIRLQSWLWLAMQGVIAPTDPVRDAWAHLSDQTRVELIRHVSKHYFGLLWFRDETRKYIGTERLRALFEGLLALRHTGQLDESVEVRLLIALAEFDSPAARKRARQLISERLGMLGTAPSDEFALSDRTLEGAVYALSLSPTPEDLELFSVMCRGTNETLRSYAAFALAQIRSPGAVAETRRIILEDPRTVCGYAIDAIKYQSLRDAPLPRDYLEIVVEAMRTRSVAYYASLIDTFACIVGEDMGWNGRMGGGGYNKQAATETVQKCLEWYEAIDSRL